MQSRLSTRIEPWIEEAVERHGQGENVGWEMGFTPTPQGPGYVLVIWLPGPVIGQSMTGQVVVTSPNLMTAETADTIIHDTLEQLRSARSEALATVPAIPGPVHPSNGQGVVGSP